MQERQKTKKGKGLKVSEEPQDAKVSAGPQDTQDGGGGQLSYPEDTKEAMSHPGHPHVRKAMVKRRREAVAVGVPAGASKAEGGDQNGDQGGKVKDPEKEEALAAKVKANYVLLKGVLDFGADVHYFPTLEANPTLKSFTVRPFGEDADKKNREDGGRKSSIGVVLFRSSFYVYKAQVPERLQEILTQKGVTGEVKRDGGGGCSLGWSRFKDVNQVCLIWFCLWCFCTHVHSTAAYEFVAIVSGILVSVFACT